MNIVTKMQGNDMNLPNAAELVYFGGNKLNLWHVNS